jgi:hypothetical protein
MKLLLGLYIFFVTQSAFAWASETSDDVWRSGWGQGWAESEVTHGSGNDIYVACESGSQMPSLISFELAGRNAPPNSEVLMIFDKKSPEGFQVDDKSVIGAGCNACAENFEYIVRKFKSFSSVYVRFVDGRESTFTLKGAAKAIGHCAAGWP